MRKAILCLIFATALLGQPTGVQVDLSVVSVDSSSGEVCFKAIVMSTGPLPTPPEFTYDYDWGNDATYDLTDTGDSVCHTYTPGDSLWAKVQATTPTYTAEDTVEVIVPEGEEEYSFNVALSDEDFEIPGLAIRDWIFDDNGTPYLIGGIYLFPGYIEVLIDTSGNVDTLYEEGTRTTRIDEYLQKEYWHSEVTDTFYALLGDSVDTMIIEEDFFDSTVVTPILGGEQWKFTNYAIIPQLIRDDGWAFAQIGWWDTTGIGWEWAILRNGEPVTEIDLPGEPLVRFNYIDDKLSFQQKGDYLAISSKDSTGAWTISVFDTSGTFLYSRESLGDSFVLLPDGSIVYGSSSSPYFAITRSLDTTDYSYEMEQRLASGFRWASDSTYVWAGMFLRDSLEVKTEQFFYFDISDSLSLIWHIQPEDNYTRAGILPSGDLLISEYFGEGEGIGFAILSENNGDRISEWSEATPPYYSEIKYNADYLLIMYSSDGVPLFKLVRVAEGGE